MVYFPTAFSIFQQHFLFHTSFFASRNDKRFALKVGTQILKDSMPTSLEHLAGGTVSFSDGGSGVQGREMFLIDGPVLECARRNVADLGRGVDGGFCSNEEEKVSE